MCTDLGKEKISKILSDPNIQNKINETKRKNHSFNSAKVEEKLYNILIEIFGKDDMIYQYRDEKRYPFNCDFYVKSKDWFIELQGYWTHGKMPYNPEDNNCKKLLKKWKEKGWDYAIKNWTITDVLKRNTAKQHQLTYIEIFKLRYWSVEKFKKFFSEIKTNEINILL